MTTTIMKQPDSRSRSSSFADLDEVQASGILEDIVRENNVLLGGSSIGKGFKKAARAYLKQQQLEVVEDAFYVVDLGVLVSQVYQWRKYFSRVEPFYAVKCNPDPVMVKTLALLGCNFDCASQQEIAIVQQCAKELHMRPEIIYANPCKARKHLQYAVQHGVTLVTLDNVQEVHKCAAVSHKIELVVRIVTDDRGAQCRLSSKYGAPQARWRNLLQAAAQAGLKVRGVSFHVGSGCRDASRYFAALEDARALFDLAATEFGMQFDLLDIGGGFPGETHSTWNPEVLDEHDDDDDDCDKEGLEPQQQQDNDDKNSTTENAPYMFFNEIAETVAPMIDALFPSHVRVIAEPGRYFTAAAATLVTSVIGARSNEIDHQQFTPEPVPDVQTSHKIFERSREDEHALVRRRRNKSVDTADSVEDGKVWETLTEELNHYAQVFTMQNLVTQETDAYNDGLDLYHEDFDTAADLLGVPDKIQMRSVVHSVEGMNKAIALDTQGEETIISLAAAGEAAVSGMVLQAVADSAPLQDDYAYYVNDGVYGAFNNLMFDHATIGDWLYFQNMGSYTMAAASSFNGFEPTEKMYVCSVQPEYFEELIAGPEQQPQQVEVAATKKGNDNLTEAEVVQEEEKKEEELLVVR
ncbi:Antizyme inhibitor 1 [Seminavis robusta]|uniref:ornithine decarboxylase n=1 Tax=Seminavis robusta TaxID=568900 RepID=A0A9N8HII4_9STRA|nr:Antizyme inhibitor 1 [Seminavis robusta]|eukprot:Sro787_g202310.1 Antizyme inhibitor 1 (636) ;mRNA; f:10950-13058